LVKVTVRKASLNTFVHWPLVYVNVHKTVALFYQTLYAIVLLPVCESVSFGSVRLGLCCPDFLSFSTGFFRNVEVVLSKFKKVIRSCLIGIWWPSFDFDGDYYFTDINREHKPIIQKRFINRNYNITQHNDHITSKNTSLGMSSEKELTQQFCSQGNLSAYRFTKLLRYFAERYMP
jgi:hypothetical protein